MNKGDAKWMTFWGLFWLVMLGSMIAPACGHILGPDPNDVRAGDE